MPAASLLKFHVSLKKTPQKDAPIGPMNSAALAAMLSAKICIPFTHCLKFGGAAHYTQRDVHFAQSARKRIFS